MTSTALLPYPSRFQGGTSGWVWPAASVARARRGWRPTSSAAQSNDQSCQWYGPGGGSTRAGCQSPSPVRLTSTWVTGPVPGPRLAAHRVRSPVNHRTGCGSGDPRAHAHQADRLRLPIGPVVHVVARLELADEGLGEHLDALQ